MGQPGPTPTSALYDGCWSSDPVSPPPPPFPPQLKYRESSSHTIQKLEVTALYAALDDDVQHNIFNPAPPNTRKCIVATNIAETSVTIPGIVYVVDCGYHKRDFYDPTHSANSLIVVPTSKMTAQQRAGRAGRTRPGKCFRLYTELAFQDACPDECRPAMQRSNLASVAPMRDQTFALRGGGGGVGTRPRYSVVCLWRRLLASRHCSF